MFDNLEEFGAALARVENNSQAPVQNKTKVESALDLGAYDLDPVHEGIIQTGLNKVSNMLGSSIKSKISNEWKHLDDEDRLVLLRIIAGDENAYSTENGNVDKALAKAFIDKTLTPTKDSEGAPAISVNRDLDLSHVASERFPAVSIAEVNGNLKCSYSAFNSLVNFPESVNSFELIKGKGHLKDLNGIPEITGFNGAKYSIDMKYTNLDSLAGWKATRPIKGHVSFRGCDLKDLKVSGVIYINGILDIRENKNISVETLKTILLKGYSNGSIIAKGGIYHSLEADGYYDSALIQQDHFVNDSLGGLNESNGGPKSAVLTPQADLWAIGAEIIKQATENKGNQQPSATVKETIQPVIQAKVETAVKDIVSNQMNSTSVNNASQTIKSGVASDEFRKMLASMFDQLIRQISEMMKSGGNGDSSKVEATTSQIASAVADNAAEQLEAFGKNIDSALQTDSCPNWKEVDKLIINAIHNIPKIATAPLTQIQLHANNLNEYKVNGNREKYTAEFSQFYKALNTGVLAKPAPSEKEIEKMVVNCFGEKPEEAPTSTPEVPASAPVAPEAPVSPEATPEAPDSAPVTPDSVPETPAASVTPEATPVAPTSTPAPKVAAPKATGRTPVAPAPKATGRAKTKVEKVEYDENGIPKPTRIPSKVDPGVLATRIVSNSVQPTAEMLNDPNFISYLQGLSGQSAKLAKNVFNGVNSSFLKAGLGDQLMTALAPPQESTETESGDTPSNNQAESKPTNKNEKALAAYARLTGSQAKKSNEEGIK